MNSKLLVQVVGAHGTKTPDSKKLGCSSEHQHAELGDLARTKSNRAQCSHSRPTPPWSS